MQLVKVSIKSNAESIRNLFALLVELCTFSTRKRGESLNIKTDWWITKEISLWSLFPYESTNINGLQYFFYELCPKCLWLSLVFSVQSLSSFETTGGVKGNILYLWYSLGQHSLAKLFPPFGFKLCRETMMYELMKKANNIFLSH